MSRFGLGPDVDFGPYEDEYRGFELSDEDSGRGPMILVLALGVLLIFAGVVWNTYRQGVRPSEGGLPVIAENSAPYKRAPDERGGLTVAGQDKGFYDMMDGRADEVNVEPAPVTPPAEEALRGLAGGPDQVAQDLPPVQRVQVIDVEPMQSNVDLDVLDARRTAASELRPVQTASLKPVPVQSEPQSTPQLAEPIPAPVPQAWQFVETGAFQVQLMAVRSEANAQSEWARIKAGNPELFGAAKLDLQRADLGAKGVFYRLRVGGFETRDSAKGFCADVKAAGRDCIVTSKAVG
ncbi:MAG: SPOR domain-containing protein [Henriciella sp.]|nr:SPOR domain-containing protein [Henriciella sp.]